MGEQAKTPLHAALIVASALAMYKGQYPLVGEEIEEIQSTGSVPRIRLKFKTGETFVIDITREPRAHRNTV
jgi:hypothetical protein